jgi:hypothetical protein
LAARRLGTPGGPFKPQLQQRMQAAYLDKYFKELRTKNGV